MENETVCLVEQNMLPFEFKIFKAASHRDTCMAISTMIVRGAGAIGATAGYAMAQAYLESSDDPAYIDDARKRIENTRPTAQNLFYAVERVCRAGQVSIQDAVKEAQLIADEDASACNAIGELGNDLIENGCNIETHCNAGWLAFVEHGTATAPMYAAHAKGIPIHVYVSETRPRNQGARLTAWELQQAGVPFTVIADNSSGHLMQHGKVDFVIVGSDRTTISGDVCNKIGTYMKAVVAKEHGIPFYAALPSSTLDPTLHDGVAEIPIEERGGHEVTKATGFLDGRQVEPQTSTPGAPAANYAFDVTPRRYVTGIITERGISEANEEALLGLYPEFAAAARTRG